MTTAEQVDSVAEKVSKYVEEALNKYNDENGPEATALLETLTRHAIFVRAVEYALESLLEPSFAKNEFADFMNAHHNYLMMRYITAIDMSQDVLEAAAKESHELIKQIYELQKCLDTGKAH